MLLSALALSTALGSGWAEINPENKVEKKCHRTLNKKRQQRTLRKWRCDTENGCFCLTTGSESCTHIKLVRSLRFFHSFIYNIIRLCKTQRRRPAQKQNKKNMCECHFFARILPILRSIFVFLFLFISIDKKLLSGMWLNLAQSNEWAVKSSHRVKADRIQTHTHTQSIAPIACQSKLYNLMQTKCDGDSSQSRLHLAWII